MRLEERTEEQTEEKGRRAVKRILTNSSNLRKEYEQELKALLEFSKPKHKEAAVFIEFLGWFEDHDSVYLAMEYVPYGDLEDNIPPKGEPINELEIREIASPSKIDYRLPNTGSANASSAVHHLRLRT